MRQCLEKENKNQLFVKNEGSYSNRNSIFLGYFDLLASVVLLDTLGDFFFF